MGKLLTSPLTLITSNRDHGRVKEGFERNVKALGVEYIDLYVRAAKICEAACDPNAWR